MKIGEKNPLMGFEPLIFHENCLIPHWDSNPSYENWHKNPLVGFKPSFFLKKLSLKTICQKSKTLMVNSLVTLKSSTMQINQFRASFQGVI